MRKHRFIFISSEENNALSLEVYQTALITCISYPRRFSELRVNHFRRVKLRDKV